MIFYSLLLCQQPNTCLNSQQVQIKSLMGVSIHVWRGGQVHGSMNKFIVDPFLVFLSIASVICGQSYSNIK